MTYDQIDRMVRKANPLPDPGILVAVDAPVLTTPLERRMEMQTDDRVKVDDGGKNRLTGPLVGIAAAAAILLGGLVFFLTNDDPPVATPAPNATRLIGEDMHPIAPGAYYADTDGDEGTTTRGTFVIEGNAWGGFQGGVLADSEGGGIAVSMLVLQVDRVWEAPYCDGGASAPAGTSAKALADQFAAMPGFTTLEGLTPVSAFGRDGYHLVLEVPGNCAGNDPNVWSSPAFFATDRSYGLGDIVEYWFLDVEGTPVMVEATQWSSLPTEENVAELREVLDTLVITP